MKLIHFIRENTWSRSIPHGWGNGYVAVPPEHPFHGKNYTDLIDISRWRKEQKDLIRFNGSWIGLLCAAGRSKNKIDIGMLVNVHGGITWAAPAGSLNNEPKNIPKNWWVFGFDTGHVDDDKYFWPKDEVLKETLRLKWELYKYSKL